MRRALTVSLLGLLTASFLSAAPALAQGRGGGQDQQRQEQEAAKKKKRDQEWNQPAAPLPQLRNAGPCPFVKVLYDAGRYVEFKDNQEAVANVAWTGEIQGVSAGCEYKDEEPIRMQVELLFALGKGPQATGDTKHYRYWVAVTQRNQSIIAKEYFDLPVKFTAGQDRAFAQESLKGIVIPRANIETSGSNFEVLIGFEVTPQMAAFNRDGKRFRLQAGSATASTGTPTQP
ncbi:Tat pathway signal sequence domain protein [Caulobacter mirabilis]|uniref:Tat pathway signal sequence domain protein n=1 Tax=Caulobacter mirabilis TaxID=69666 RepID=A0A2D2ATJ0_9CAUL|nr:Tat pathway signal sequence domain protein [Caulobacter mirabilis]ATQ41293.1 Tat pathway signal sequence domain protein [Caulobacter mirabilis]